MKKLKKLTRSQNELLDNKLKVNSNNYLVERNTSEIIVFYNTKTNEKIVYHKTFNCVVEDAKELRGLQDVSCTKKET